MQEYKWFGRENATPEEMFFYCPVCDSSTTEEISLINTTKKVCPQCTRRSLQLQDVARWVFFLKFNLKEWFFFCDQYNNPFGYYYETGRTYHLTAKTYEAIHRGKAPDASDALVGRFLSYCLGLAYGGEKRTLYTRLRRRGGGVEIDIGGKMIIRLDGEGWSHGTLPPAVFRSSDHMRDFVVDVGGGKQEWEEFRNIFNLENQDSRILFEVWCATALIPNIPHPILIPVGEQGAAKTTLCSLTKNLIDPSILSVLSLPKNTGELILQLQESLVVAYDNITELDVEQTDIICQAITGFSFSKRKLFTDGDSYARNLQSILILNGINTPSARPDLIDRSIILELSRIQKEQRKTLEDVQATADFLMPKARGYLLNVAAAGLRQYESVKKELAGRLPRMADWAIYAEAVSRAFGYAPYEFIIAYDKNEAARIEEAVVGDAIASFLIELGTGGWEGTPTELLQELFRMAEASGIKTSNNKDFPQAPNSLSRRLRSLKTILSEKKIRLENTHTGANRKIKLSRIQTEAGQKSLGEK